MLYVLKRLIYYDSVSGDYLNLISINKKPNDDNINKYIKYLHYKSISPYDRFNSSSCIYVFVNDCKYYEEEDIEEVLCLLMENGYKLEHELTKNMCKKNKDVIYYISK